MKTKTHALETDVCTRIHIISILCCTINEQYIHFIPAGSLAQYTQQSNAQGEEDS